MRGRFLEQIAHASRMSGAELTEVLSVSDLERIVAEQSRFPAPFGGMTPLGFAQVGRGIGDSGFRGVAA